MCSGGPFLANGVKCKELYGHTWEPSLGDNWWRSLALFLHLPVAWNAHAVFCPIRMKLRSRSGWAGSRKQRGSSDTEPPCHSWVRYLWALLRKRTKFLSPLSPWCVKFMQDSQLFLILINPYELLSGDNSPFMVSMYLKGFHSCVQLPGLKESTYDSGE